jgi:hypothetical protein
MGALAVIAVSLAAVLATAQAPKGTAEAAKWTQTTTPWGDPDLQGVWSGTTPTPLERPLDGGKVLLTDAEVDDLEKELARRFEAPSPGDPGTYNAFWQDRGRALKGRTSLIVDPPDGRLPLTPEAKKRADAARAAGRRLFAGPEDVPLGTRCLHWERLITGGVNQYYRIVQAPGYVAMNMMRMHDNRIIYLDGRPHLPHDVRQWTGDSRGHWEGTTLVVDTTNFTDTREDRWGSKNLHLVERFTRVDVDTINYEATLEDPTMWTRPWTLALPLTKDPEGSVGVFEYACHEGNYSMVGILGGARAEERAATKAAKGKKGSSK